MGPTYTADVRGLKPNPPPAAVLRAATDGLLLAVMTTFGRPPTFEAALGVTSALFAERSASESGRADGRWIAARGVTNCDVRLAPTAGPMLSRLILARGTNI